MARLIEASDEHLRLIGLITVRWSWVDSLMADLAGIKLGDPADGIDMIFGKGTSASVARFGRFREWAETQDFDTEEMEIISKSTISFSRLWDERNNITHSPFGFGHQWDKRTKDLEAGLGYNRHRGQNPGFVICPPERLLKHANGVLEAALPLWEVRQEHVDKWRYPYDPR